MSKIATPEQAKEYLKTRFQKGEHQVFESEVEGGYTKLSFTTEVMGTTAPRPVLFSALTTIGSFGSIALSSHPGTSSMGVLLTIAIVSTLICTLIFLPTLMTIWPAKIRNGSA